MPLAAHPPWARRQRLPGLVRHGFTHFLLERVLRSRRVEERADAAADGIFATNQFGWHGSGYGTKRLFAPVAQRVGWPGKADLGWLSGRSSRVSGSPGLCGPKPEFDPNVWSGRASQEVFVELAMSGLASMYPASGWSSLGSGPSWKSARLRSH